MSHYELIKKEKVDSSDYILIVWWWIICILSLGYLVIKSLLLWSMIIAAILFISQIVGLVIKEELKPTNFKIVLHVILHFAMLYGALYMSDLTDWISMLVGIIFYVSSYRLSRSYNSIKNQE